MTRRTFRRGEEVKVYNTATATSSGATAATIRNHGVTVLPASPPAVYVLDAPVEGVVKTIVCSAAPSSGDAAVRVYTSPGASTLATVSVGAAGATASVLVMGSSATTAQPSVTLVGKNSTHWDVIAMGGGVATATA